MQQIMSPTRNANVFGRERSRSRPGTGFNVIIDNSYLQYASDLNQRVQSPSHQLQDSAVNYSRVTPIGLPLDSFEMPADEKRVVSNQNRTAVPKVQLYQPFRTLDNRSGGSLEPDL